MLVIKALLQLPPEQRGGKAAEGDAGMERRQALILFQILLYWSGTLRSGGAGLYRGIEEWGLQFGPVGSGIGERANQGKDPKLTSREGKL